MAARRLEKRDGGRRVFVRFADDGVAEGHTPDLDLERADFEMSFESPRDTATG